MTKAASKRESPDSCLVQADSNCYDAFSAWVSNEQLNKAAFWPTGTCVYWLQGRLYSSSCSQPLGFGERRWDNSYLLQKILSSFLLLEISLYEVEVRNKYSGFPLSVQKKRTVQYKPRRNQGTRMGQVQSKDDLKRNTKKSNFGISVGKLEGRSCLLMAVIQLCWHWSNSWNSVLE